MLKDYVSRHPDGECHCNGIDALGRHGIDCQVTDGLHARFLDVGLHLGGPLTEVDVLPDLGIAVFLDSQVEVLVTGGFGITVGQQGAPVLVDVSGQRTFDNPNLHHRGR